MGQSQDPDRAPLSPYIAESLRRAALEAEQAKVLARVVHELVPTMSFHVTTAEKLRALRFEAREKRRSSRSWARRRARMYRSEVVGRVDRSEIIARDKSTCYLCGKVCERREIHLDHVIPLSKGGPHSAENVRVACALCNIRKGADLPSS